MKAINKTILTVVVAGLIAMGATFGIMDRIYKKNISEINATHVAEVTAIQSSRDSLRFHSDSIDMVLSAYEAKIDSLESDDIKHRVEIDDLKMRLKRVLNDMWDRYLEDNGLYAYDYLQGRYLSQDTLEYLFSGEQVTHIATDIIKGDYLDSLLKIEQARLVNLEKQVINYKVINSTLVNERDDCELLADELYKQLAAKIEENKLSEEEIADLKRKLRRLRASGIIGAAGVALLLILL